MAIYRADTGRRSLLIAAGAVALGLVLGIAIGRLTAPGLGAQMDDLRAQVAPIRSSLEVVRTEYSKFLAGGSDPGGTTAALAKIDSTYAAVAPTLDLLDQQGSQTLREAIGNLRSMVQAKVPQEEIDAAASGVRAALDAVVPPAPGPLGA